MVGNKRIIVAITRGVFYASRTAAISAEHAETYMRTVVSLAKLQQQRERLRYEKEKGTITFLRDSGRLRPGLSHKTARDIFWLLTGGDVCRMLVSDRRWSPQQYQDWLADTLVYSLLAIGKTVRS